MQQISKHTSLTTEAAFSMSSMQSGYKEVFSSIELSSFEMPACQDMSLGAEELNSVESLELAVAE
jgi:hypothetical protein